MNMKKFAWQLPYLVTGFSIRDKYVQSMSTSFKIYKLSEKNLTKIYDMIPGSKERKRI